MIDDFSDFLSIKQFLQIGTVDCIIYFTAIYWSTHLDYNTQLTPN